MCKSDFVRSLDFFAVPVSLTYKGEKWFKTQLGGYCTLVLILSFFIYCGFALEKLMFNPVLVNNSYNSFFSSYLNTDIYNISTTNSTLAVRIAGGVNLGEHLQVVFS